jgi:large subunit ribosomal protein L3
MAVKALLGKKREMSQVFTDDGRVIPVTIVEAGPCPVVQVKTADGSDKYCAYQLAWGERREKNTPKPMVGHLKKAGVGPMRVLKEYKYEGEPELKVGDVITVGAFAEGDMVDVQARTKGKGFQGGIKRHNFKSGPRGHGSKNTREPGATGTNTTPGRVLKGKRMPGHLGDVQVTTRNLRVVRVLPERNLLYLAGAVPGHNNADVFVREAISGSRRKGAKKAE